MLQRWDGFAASVANAINATHLGLRSDLPAVAACAQCFSSILHPPFQVVTTVSDTCTGVTTMAGNTVNTVTCTAGSAVNHVTTTTGNVVNSAKSTAGTTVDGVKVCSFERAFWHSHRRSDRLTTEKHSKSLCKQKQNASLNNHAKKRTNAESWQLPCLERNQGTFARVIHEKKGKYSHVG